LLILVTAALVTGVESKSLPHTPKLDTEGTDCGPCVDFFVLGLEVSGLLLQLVLLLLLDGVGPLDVVLKLGGAVGVLGTLIVLLAEVVEVDEDVSDGCDIDGCFGD